MEARVFNGEQTPKETETNDAKKRNSVTPVHLQLPQEFSKFPERYMSPTDLLVSPVSRRILARNQRGSIIKHKPEINVE